MRVMPRQETQLYLALFVDIHRAKQKPNIYRSNLLKKKKKLSTYLLFMHLLHNPVERKKSEQDSL